MGRQSVFFPVVMGVAVFGVALLLMGGAHGADAARDEEGPEAGERAVRLGVFNTRAVALAYGRSDEHDAEVDSKMAEYRRAQEAGDQERMRELERWGEEGQDRIHRQVFGDAPIPDILERMKDDLPGVAEKAGVDAIVGEVLHARAGAEVVDVTEEMAARWRPDEKTREMMRQVRETPPVEWESHGGRGGDALN